MRRAGLGMGTTRIIASWGLGRMGCGSVGKILSKRDGSGSFSTDHFL